jgi:pilus assembly protein Flp/PilA
MRSCLLVVSFYGEISRKPLKHSRDLPIDVGEVYMKNLKNMLCDFVREESGQDLVEYALIIAMVSLGAIAGLQSLANVVANVPNNLMLEFYSAFTS